MSKMDKLHQEAESIVLALWDEEPEEIAAEVAVQLSISAGYAWDLVQQVIVNEVRMEQALCGEDEDLFGWDEASEETLVSEGFETEKDYF